MFLELALEPLEERYGIRRRTRKSRDHSVVVQPPRLSRRVLHDVVAHRHLPIGNQHHFILFAHAQYRSAVHRRASLALTHPSIIQPPAGSTPKDAPARPASLARCTFTMCSPPLRRRRSWRVLCRGFFAERL